MTSLPPKETPLVIISSEQTRLFAPAKTYAAEPANQIRKVYSGGWKYRIRWWLRAIHRGTTFNPRFI